MKFLKYIHMHTCTHTQATQSKCNMVRSVLCKVSQRFNNTYTYKTSVFFSYFNDLSQLDVFLVYNTIFAATKENKISDDHNGFRSQPGTLFPAITPRQCQVQNLNEQALALE